MPLPNRKKGEEKSAFVSRCVRELTKRGEGDSVEQRVAICHSRASCSLTDDEIDAIALALKRMSDS